MKTRRPIKSLVLSGMLSGVLVSNLFMLLGCTQAPASKTASTSATPTPAAQPKLSVDEALTQAKTSLTKAHGELKDKNYLGAQDYLTAAQKQLTAAAAAAPLPLKVGVEKVLATLTAIKDLKAPGTDKTLAALIPTLTTLIETANKLQ